MDVMEDARLPVIKVRVTPEVVRPQQPVRLDVQFLDWQTFGERRLVPVSDLGSGPVVEETGGERGDLLGVLRLEAVDVARGHYRGTLHPESPGTHSYLVKHRSDARSGQLVEVDVLDNSTYDRARTFFGDLLQHVLPTDHRRTLPPRR
jgi:hypothetical protein